MATLDAIVGDVPVEFKALGSGLGSRLQQAITEHHDAAATAVADAPSVAVEDGIVSTALAASVVASLGRIEQHRDMLLAGEGRVHPGQPIELSAAASVNDAIAQGDLNLVVRAAVPEGYTLRENGDGQLVPGNTTGAKHIVRDVSTVDIYDPRGWGPTYNELNGPFMVTKAPTVIDHPTHGAVTIPAGFTIENRYQRVWDIEQRKQRRQMD